MQRLYQAVQTVHVRWLTIDGSGILQQLLLLANGMLIHTLQCALLWDNKQSA
jgi:hypothetical protein